MKFGLYAFALAVASHAFGCGGDGSEGGATDGGRSDSGGNSKLTVNWATYTIEGGQTVEAACPDGVTSAIVFTQPDGSEDEPTEHKGRCSDKGLTIEGLAAGPHTVWVRMTDSTFTTRYAESEPQPVDVLEGDNAEPVGFFILFDYGYFSVSWKLLSGDSTHPVACSDISNLRGVEIEVRYGLEQPITRLVNCEYGVAPAVVRSHPIPVTVGTDESYTVKVTLTNTFGDAIGIPQSKTSTSLDYGTQDVDLGTFTLITNNPVTRP